MLFRDAPAQSGNRKVVLIGIVAAVIAAAAIADNDRVSAMLAGAALLGVGLLLVLPVRNPAQ
jgi:small-conductance mechanosensitive channel